MRFVKFIIGLGALAFVVAHLVEVPVFLDKSASDKEWIVKVSAVLIGTAIAIKCFQGAFQSKAA